MESGYHEQDLKNAKFIRICLPVQRAGNPNVPGMQDL